MERMEDMTNVKSLYSPKFEHDNCGIGAVVNIKGKKSHDTVANALTIVETLEHRAGKDAEGKTGDGVGILLQISHKFFKKIAAAELGITLGEERDYAVGMFFFPQNELARNQAKKMFEIIAEKEGLEILGWRVVPAKPEKQYGFVAVAAGNGIESMFRDIGVDCIVKGGQTMNPSTEDILAAIMSCPAETVFVLPNNKNIIMAAEQAVKLADRKVCVLQTRTIPQGMSAMLAFDPDADFNTNRIEMTNALERVATGQVTFAARDSDYEGHAIKQGEILCIENGKLSFVEKDVSKAAYKLTKKLVKGDSSFITILYGSDVTDEAAEALQKQVAAKFSNLDVNLINGGQPVYYYIISVE
jgi:hypothetical protein